MKKLLLYTLLITVVGSSESFTNITTASGQQPAKRAAKPVPTESEKSTASETEKWLELNSSEGKFVAAFPSKPLEEHTETELRYRLDLGNQVYGVLVTNTFEKTDTIQGTLDSLSKGLMAASQGKLIDRNPNLTFRSRNGSIPGFSIKYQTSSPPGVTTAHYYLSNKRLYVVIVFIREGGEDNSSRFLKSFKIL
jgi:hypothetical protein